MATTGRSMPTAAAASAIARQSAIAVTWRSRSTRSTVARAAAPSDRGRATTTTTHPLPSKVARTIYPRVASASSPHIARVYRARLRARIPAGGHSAFVAGIGKAAGAGPSGIAPMVSPAATFTQAVTARSAATSARLRSHDPSVGAQRVLRWPSRS